MNPIKFSYVSGEPYANYDYSWIRGQAQEFVSLEQEKAPNTYKWLRTNWTPIDIILRNSIDETTGEEIASPLSYSEQLLVDRKFDNELAFELIRNYTESVSRTLLIYAGPGTQDYDSLDFTPGRVQPHFHTPKRNLSGEYLGPKMTATVIIPIKIVEPVTETLCFSWQDIPYESMDLNNDVVGWEKSLALAEQCKELSNTQRIRFPNEGEYLTFYFDSSHYLHWSELNTQNEFICLVQDC
jgi:hypothetical protein